MLKASLNFVCVWLSFEQLFVTDKHFFEVWKNHCICYVQFKSRLSHTQWLKKNGAVVATLLDPWHQRVRAGSDWPSISMLPLGEVASLMCNVCSVWQHVPLCKQFCTIRTLFLLLWCYTTNREIFLAVGDGSGDQYVDMVGSVAVRPFLSSQSCSDGCGENKACIYALEGAQQ